MYQNLVKISLTVLEIQVVEIGNFVLSVNNTVYALHHFLAHGHVS